MGREVRMVPKDWEHPKREGDGGYNPLYDGYRDALIEFEIGIREKGLAEAIDYWGGGPTTYTYMPAWTEEEANWFMMYETTTEGTPISPAFETKEELARWLADTGASAFGRMTATYKEWLGTIERGGALSAFFSVDTGIISGVQAEYNMSTQE